ncbi:MAG: MarR family transcriptional regulator [Actinomycetaceae bacterium]|nr:MarR family transcriptional regulator [Actinomycetaceae bacterium]
MSAEENLEQWINLTTLLRKIEATIEDALPTDLSLQDFQVLAVLGAAEHGRLRMSSLAHRVGLTKSGITRAVARLVERGLVCRRSCPKDQRATYAVITEKGAALRCRAVDVTADPLQENFFAALSPNDLRSFRRVMEALEDGLSESGACTSWD